MLRNKKIVNREDNSSVWKILKDYLLQIPNFLTVFLIPITFLSIGPVLIEIGKDFGTTPENINMIFTFFPAGMVAGQLTSTFYNRYFKRINIIIFAYSIMIVINCYLFFAKNLYIFFILSVIQGYLIGINYVQSTENIIACNIRNKDRLFIILLIFFPLGAMVAPLISSTLVNNNISWRYTYLIILLLMAITGILYILISLKDQNKIIPKKDQKVSIKEIFINKKKNIVFVTILLVSAVYTVSEAILTTWTPTYLRLMKDIDINIAAFSITIFMLFTIIGRALLSIVIGRVNAKIIILILSGVVIISILFLISVNTKLLIFISMGLAGFGYSAIFPIIVSLGSAIYEKGKGFVASLILASSNVGKTIAPYMTKKIVTLNLTFSMTVSIIFTGICAIFIFFLLFYDKKIKD